MSNDPHRVSGIYATRREADVVYDRLLREGFQAGQIELIDQPGANAETDPDSDEVLNEMLVGGAIGTAAGAGAGALGSAAIAAANVSLFIASPLLGTLMMVGWGASVGGIVGASMGLGTVDTKRFDDLVKQAVSQGHAVLIVHAETEEQTTLAQAVIGESLKDLTDEV